MKTFCVVGHDARQRAAAQTLQAAGQYRRGDGVDDGIMLCQQHGQAVQRGGAVPRTPGVGPLHGIAGCNGGMPAQQVQPPRYRPADASVAENQEVAFPDGAAAQLQQQGKAALCGGHGV